MVPSSKISIVEVLDPVICFVCPTARIEIQWCRRVSSVFISAVHASIHMYNGANLILPLPKIIAILELGGEPRLI